MMWRAWRGAASAVLMVAVLVVWGAAPVSAKMVPIAGTLTATKACEAYVSKNKMTNPESAKLVPGQAYPVHARNKPEGEWLQISVPNVPKRRWVEVGCGTLVLSAEQPKPPEPKEGGKTPNKGSGANASCPSDAKDLKPFFDASAETLGYNADPTPQTVAEDDFDKKVLALCGGWGTHLGGADLIDDFEAPATAAEKVALKALFEGAPEVIEAVWAHAKQVNATFSVPKDGFAATLTEIWSKDNAFRHIFCGEPRPEADKLGGFHFGPRYKQAGENHWAGISAKPQQCKDCGVYGGVVYTVAACYAAPKAGNKVLLDTIKGYALGISAKAFLADATAGFYKVGNQGGKVCATFDPKRSYQMQVWAKDGGLSSAYPIGLEGCQAK